MAETTTRRPRKKVDPNETADVKFTRLINARGEKLTHQMKLLKNLTTSYAYKADAALAEEWLQKIQSAYSGLKTALEASIMKNKPKIAEASD